VFVRRVRIAVADERERSGQLQAFALHEAAVAIDGTL